MEITALQEKAVEAAQKAALKRIKKVRENISAKYPHADVDTLTFDETAQKYRVQIICEECGARRWTFTSDLFQIKLCDGCRASARKARKKIKGEELKRLLLLLKEQEAKASAKTEPEETEPEETEPEETEPEETQD